MFYQSLHSAYFLNSIQVFFMLQFDPFDYCCIICTCACMFHNFYLAIWKSRHWQLGIGISISICIGIAKILVSAYEFFFLESRTFMSNTPKFFVVLSYLCKSAVFKIRIMAISIHRLYRSCLGSNPFICFWNRMLKKDFTYVWELPVKIIYTNLISSLQNSSNISLIIFFKNSLFSSFSLTIAGWYTREDKDINDQIIIYGKVDFILFSSLHHEFFIA